MSEIPEGLELPDANTSKIRRSASVVLSRKTPEGHEVLLGHRVSELASFPDYWAFPGGGISRVDLEAAKILKGKLDVGDSYEEACFALLREMVEEIGLSPGGGGTIVEVSPSIRESVCGDKSEWLRLVNDGEIVIEGFHCEMITDRTTPPFSPMRFQNYFFHVPMEDSMASPTFPPGRSEFDDFRWWRPRDLIQQWEENTVRLPPPIVTLVRDLAMEAERQGDLLSACEKLSNDPPSGEHRIEFAPNVEVFPLRTETIPPSTHTNCYILGELGGECVVVDPAAKSEESLAYLESKISEVVSSGSKIVATIFTHRHPDHIGDLSRISEIYDAPIWASSITLDSISHEGLSSIIEEGDSFALRGASGMIEWEVIETPGHCPGHICLVGDSGIVSGDNCVVVGTILVPSSDGNMNSYISGLERILSLGPTMLFPGHGPACTNPTRILERYIKHRTARHDGVLNAVSSGLSSLEEITLHAYQDSPDAHPILSRDQALSHLNSLVESNIVEVRAGHYFPA
ncbi:MAG: MBL fold metallo-hydrolase [Candidatus Thalassarchaeaceae archaeon]|nr:MAG: MBL fold metallo-hydrolase [Candidatus Poseidoniales archaeon]